MADWVYTDTIKEHFAKPQNVLVDEDSYKEDGKGYVGNPKCGDMMLVKIKVDKENDKITEFKWKTYGCASAIASTSMLSVIVTENGGMKISDALKITYKDIMDRLGSLPQNKVHCSVLGDKALKEAVYDFYRNSGQKDKIPVKEKKVICECLNVTEEEIEEDVLEGVDTFEQLQERTKIATGCGKCKDEAIAVFERLKEKYKV